MGRGAFLLLGCALVLVSGCRPPPPERPLVCGLPQQHGYPWVQGALPNQCGATLDLTPVNYYKGEFAPVMDREDAVVLIGGRCTGTWIQASAGPVVLTAGHCVTLDERVLVVFNHEVEADGEELITEGTVFEVSTEPDYALIQLDAQPATPPLSLTSRSDERLAIIQHPRGTPKVVAEGWFEASCNDLVYYSDLDTLVGTSGAGILTRGGFLLGIHTGGDCDETGAGTNRGWTAERITAASAYLVPEDVADR